jgi:hypothetical protein
MMLSFATRLEPDERAVAQVGLARALEASETQTALSLLGGGPGIRRGRGRGGWAQLRHLFAQLLV